MRFNGTAERMVPAVNCERTSRFRASRPERP
jgi:hypothetical protein